MSHSFLQQSFFSPSTHGGYSLWKAWWFGSWKRLANFVILKSFVIQLFISNGTRAWNLLVLGSVLQRGGMQAKRYDSFALYKIKFVFLNEETKHCRWLTFPQADGRGLC